MLDASAGTIHRLRGIYRKRGHRPSLTILQLRTPLTQYARDGLNSIKYGLDNGSFTDFDVDTFERMAFAAIGDDLCLWVAMPDVVGDHQSTLVLYEHWLIRLDYDGETKKRCFVLQDGCNLHHPDFEPPWDILDAVFVGGTDHYKESRDCYEVVEKAKALGKWVHVGRVNSPSRITYWHDIADSFDGSGIARFDDMKTKAFDTLLMLKKTHQLKISESESYVS